MNSYTGLGHDAESWAYDGSYQVAWHGSSRFSFSILFEFSPSVLVKAFLLAILLELETDVFLLCSNNTRYGEYWNNGDIIGCVLDLEAKQMSFYRNGKDLGTAFTGFSIGDGLYPAASLQYGQKLSFNFGKEPFKVLFVHFFFV